MNRLSRPLFAIALLAFAVAVFPSEAAPPKEDQRALVINDDIVAPSALFDTLCLRSYAAIDLELGRALDAQAKQIGNPQAVTLPTQPDFSLVRPCWEYG